MLYLFVFIAESVVQLLAGIMVLWNGLRSHWKIRPTDSLEWTAYGGHWSRLSWAFLRSMPDDFSNDAHCNFKRGFRAYG